MDVQCLRSNTPRVPGIHPQLTATLMTGAKKLSSSFFQELVSWKCVKTRNRDSASTQIQDVLKGFVFVFGFWFWFDLLVTHSKLPQAAIVFQGRRIKTYDGAFYRVGTNEVRLVGEQSNKIPVIKSAPSPDSTSLTTDQLQRGPKWIEWVDRRRGTEQVATACQNKWEIILSKSVAC